jgi:sugar/nucleoside kinase (ribokinase family)
LIITKGSKGCWYNSKDYKLSKPSEVRDVSGAGDTFISALCCQYLKTRKIEDSILFANECATTVVQKRGVSTI